MDECQISTTAKVAFLSNPGNYPESAGRVEVVETHMAWVFMAEKYVYKLKKPVRYPYLDFSSIALREFYCHEEVRLNQRLAPGVYLGVVPLTCNRRGLAIDGKGSIVDWLVRMRRLPRRQMLDWMLRDGRLGACHLRRLAHLLAEFHGSCQSLPFSGEAYRQRYRNDIERNLEALQGLRSALGGVDYRSLGESQLSFLEHRSDWFDARAREGNVIEAHGDLRPQHICFPDEKPLIIDCLEFNPDLRILDKADETAYLAMECAWLGYSEAGKEFLAYFEQCSKDHVPFPLRAFYMAYRASLRARLLLSRLREIEPARWSRWQQRAYRYLDLAKRYTRALSG